MSRPTSSLESLCSSGNSRSSAPDWRFERGELERSKLRKCRSPPWGRSEAGGAVPSGATGRPWLLSRVWRCDPSHQGSRADGVGVGGGGGIKASCGAVNASREATSRADETTEPRAPRPAPRSPKPTKAAAGAAAAVSRAARGAGAAPATSVAMSIGTRGEARPGARRAMRGGADAAGAASATCAATASARPTSREIG
eukprot:scaffold4882_cov70-Phaeocystis_antarctica.AAC.1